MRTFWSNTENTKKMNNSIADKIATYVTGVIATIILVYTMHFMFMFPKTIIVAYIILSAVHMTGLGKVIIDKLSGLTRV
jgi:succinate dehydrogenase hydrophobic anchor subunit